MVIRKTSARPPITNNKKLITIGAIIALAMIAPIRLFEYANPDWRPLSWVHALTVVGLTLMVIGYWGGQSSRAAFCFPGLFHPRGGPVADADRGPAGAMAHAHCRLRRDGNADAFRHSRATRGQPHPREQRRRRSERSVQRGALAPDFAHDRAPLWRTETPNDRSPRRARRRRTRDCALREFRARTFPGLDRSHTESRRGREVARHRRLRHRRRRLCRHDRDRFRARENSGERTRLACPGRRLAGQRRLKKCGLGSGRHGRPYTLHPPPTRLPPALFLLSTFAFLLSIETAVSMWYRWHESKLVPGRQWTVQWPEDAPGFKEVPIDDHTREMLRYDTGRQATWTVSPVVRPETTDAIGRERPGQAYLFFFRWEPGTATVLRARAHRPDICLPAVGWTQFGQPEIRSYPVEKISRCRFSISVSSTTNRAAGRFMPRHFSACARTASAPARAAKRRAWRSVTGASRSAGKWCAKACAIPASRCWSSFSSRAIRSARKRRGTSSRQWCRGW